MFCKLIIFLQHSIIQNGELGKTPDSEQRDTTVTSNANMKCQLTSKTTEILN